MEEKERTLDDFILKPEKPSLRRRGLIVGGLLLALFVAGIFIMRGGIDAALVKQQLDIFAADLREGGKHDGRHIEFTYGDIEIIGGVASRRAVIHDVKLLVKPEGGMPGTATKPNSVLVSSPALELVAHDSDFTSISIALPMPVDVASEEDPTRSLLKVSANAPIVLDMAQKDVNGTLYMQWHQAWPSEVRISYLKEQQAAGMEEQTPSVVPVYQTLVVTSGRVEGDLNMAQDDSGLGEGTLIADNVIVMPENMPEGAIKVGQVRGLWRNTLDDKQQKSMDSTMTIDAITAAPEIIPYAPVSFAFEASQRGSMPLPGKPIADTASYQLKTFRLRTKDASVDADADFATAAGELLPVGKANLKVVNLPFVVGELKSFRLLGEQNDRLLTVVVESVSGQPYAEVKNLDVAINRPQGGAFTIGKSTFEELFAIVLKTKLEELNGGQPMIIAPPERMPTVAPAAGPDGSQT